MNDTSKKSAELFQKVLMNLPSEKRLKMGCSMYDTAKSIVRDSILNESKDISENELNKRIFLRFYGNETKKDLVVKIFG